MQSLITAFKVWAPYTHYVYLTRFSCLSTQTKLIYGSHFLPSLIFPALASVLGCLFTFEARSASGPARFHYQCTNALWFDIINNYNARRNIIFNYFALSVSNPEKHESRKQAPETEPISQPVSQSVSLMPFSLVIHVNLIKTAHLIKMRKIFPRPVPTRPAMPHNSWLWFNAAITGHFLPPIESHLRANHNRIEKPMFKYWLNYQGP